MFLFQQQFCGYPFSVPYFSFLSLSFLLPPLLTSESKRDDKERDCVTIWKELFPLGAPKR